MKIVINTNYISAGTVILNGIERRFIEAGFTVVKNDWKNYLDYDVAIFMAPDSKIKEAKSINKNLFCILFDPKVSLDWQIKEIKIADLLIVSSIEQKEYLLKYNKNTFIYYMLKDVPNIIKEHTKKEKIIIGYHGNKQHLSAMGDVSWALDELVKNYDIEFRAMYNIEKLGKWTKNVPKICPVKHLQWSEEGTISEMSKCDIGIVPSVLHNSPFWGRPIRTFIINDEGYHNHDYVQRFKFTNNPGRIQVFSQFSVPVVADFTPSACQIIKDGESGFLVGTKEGWYCAIESLIKDYKLRNRFSKNLQLKFLEITPDTTFNKLVDLIKEMYAKTR